MAKRKTAENRKILDVINPSDALQILRILSQNDPTLTNRIEEIFQNHIQEVDVVGIADEIYSDLEFLDVEEIWDKCGSNRYGYTSEDEAACELIEAVIEPHLENMKRLHSLGMFYEEMRYCMGIASGLQQFEDEATTEFKNWAEDIAGDLSDQILSEWTESCNDPKLRAEMAQFKDSG